MCVHAYDKKPLEDSKSVAEKVIKHVYLLLKYVCVQLN